MFTAENRLPITTWAHTVTCTENIDGKWDAREQCTVCVLIVVTPGAAVIQSKPLNSHIGFNKGKQLSYAILCFFLVFQGQEEI